MVRLLEEYNADARIKNNNEMSAIDLAVVNDQKELKLFFMSKTKYGSESFEL